MQRRFTLLLLSFLIICLSLVTVEAQQTAFTYQGRLTDNSSPANGNYDLQFGLFDSATSGAQIGQTQVIMNISVSGGIFTVTLDFGGSAFSGANRFLEISARTSGTGSFTLLAPRQQITSTPYAVRSLNTATADVAGNAHQLGGVAAGQYVQGDDARLSDARTPTAGSPSYIQNSSSSQVAAFNISGDGTAAGTLSANVVNAATQFNLNGNRMLSSSGAGQGATSNTFAGVGTGTVTVPSPTIHFGNYNSFFGRDAGAVNSSGSMNSIFGSYAGSTNTTGVGNSLFGAYAGNRNTEAYFNSFFGLQAGQNNTTGSNGSFFGYLAGNSNTTGVLNSFFGYQAGGNNVSGRDNSFVGQGAGGGNLQGSFNSFFGTGAGASNRTEDYNTFLGAFANGATGITNATAIGARAQVTQSNSLVLGSINGVNGATANIKVGIGTTAPVYKLHVVDPANFGLRVQTSTGGGAVASFGGSGDFSIDGSGAPGGRMNVKESGDVGFGVAFPASRFHFVDPGNRGLRVQTNTVGGTVASFGGLGDFNVDSNGDAGGRFVVKENGNTGIGTTIPSAKLEVNGIVKIAAFGSSGNTSLCKNNAGEVALCSSSRRYKTDFRPFTSGLKLINRLQPLTFLWKSDQTLDVGLGAEDVAKLEPLLVTHNDKGEVEGVKYDRLSAVFINAFKEQQDQIEQQRVQIGSLLTANARLSSRLEAVERRPRQRAASRRRHRVN